jgi:ELWxxDGT repeat protein
MRRNALVGSLTTADVDFTDRHTYILVPGAADNSFFNIPPNSNQLRANDSFDYEARSSYTVRIRSTDLGGLSVEKEFVITILNQDPEIRPVKDIHPGTGNSNPESFVNVNGILYFVADDGTSGAELWRSDSTSAGTVQVRDIFPGANGSTPRYLTNINGTLYFTANDGSSGVELWKSDGTSAGTVRVRDLRPGAPSSYPRSLTNVNGTLYFSANDGVAGTELWSTDGTIAGTALVKDIGLGGAGSMPRYLTNVNGTLFFRANDGTNGYELWKSDGTNANTVLMRDIREGYGGSSPQYLTNVNGTLFFTADDDANGRELWKSDGTVAGTSRVKDVWAGANSSIPGPLTNVNGTLFFTADDGVNGRELWTSNGTSTGTRLVRDIFPSAGNSYPGNFENIGGILYFRASDGVNGFELWKSDGTTAGTVMVRDLNPGGGNSYPRFLESAHGKLYFSANDGTGFKLWTSDGTTSGTVLAGTVVFNPIGTDPTYLMNVGGKLYFSAIDPLGEYGRELWVLELDNFSPSSQPPIGIQISSSAIDENAGANAPVGILSTIDSGYENTFSYSLVAGNGDSNNGDFLIDGTTLRAVNSLNFEAKSSYSIRVRSTDQNGLFTEREFLISVINIEEAPVLTRGGSSLSGNVLTTFTNTGTWSDPDGDPTSVSASLGTVVKNTDGTWAWSFVPSQATTQQIVTITAIDNKGLASQVQFTIDSLVAVVNSKVYYKGSTFANHGVNAALDSSKVIAKSGATAQALAFANLLNTTRGINGLVFDVAGLAATSLTASDFVFRMSPTGLFNEAANPPSSWTSAPSATLIEVTAGTSLTPARVRLEWPDNAIANRWLQIKVLANANTGLLAPQVYYIGHLQGETNGAIEGNAFRVRGNDMTALVAAINSGVTVPVDNIFDLDKDGRIRGTDSAAALASVGRSLTRITIPASGSAEEGEGDATRASIAAPGLETSKGSTASDDSRGVEIRARLTDELFSVLPAAASGPSIASAPFATGPAARSAATSELSMDLQLPSLDEYFDRLGRGPRSGGLRNR